MSGEHDLVKAAAAVRVAVAILTVERATMLAFLKERDLMESVGPVFAPSLFRDATRRETSEAIAPLFEIALRLIQAHQDGSDQLIRSALKHRSPPT